MCNANVQEKKLLCRVNQTVMLNSSAVPMLTEVLGPAVDIESPERSYWFKLKNIQGIKAVLGTEILCRHESDVPVYKELMFLVNESEKLKAKFLIVHFIDGINCRFRVSFYADLTKAFWVNFDWIAAIYDITHMQIDCPVEIVKPFVGRGYGTYNSIFNTYR